MKILYVTTPDEDYLQDCMLYGLRRNAGVDCVDWPKKNVMYRTCQTPGHQMYGNGFTVWKLLDDLPLDRDDIPARALAGEFPLVIFGSICRQKEQFHSLGRRLLQRRANVIFFDGEDRPSWRHSQLLGLAGPYYKRESKGIGRWLTRPTSFSIPECQLMTPAVPKTQLFAKHVQCDEAYRIDEIRRNCQKSYAFRDENAYRQNIASSYFAVTMKKAGWDCMRHYEIAASGTVMAFYRLRHKPKHCPPYGLEDMKNVVAFESAEELQSKLKTIEDQNLYPLLQQNSFRWAVENTCEKRAEQFLDSLGMPSGFSLADAA
ncbi:hypothetical protein GC176_24960 [bacterium]|nr:hypothetical protein [bacterium]